MTVRARYFVLAAILMAAAALRFTGLDAGLRHDPFIDEKFFVLAVEGMLDRGDLDPRLHIYPGLIFYLIYPPLAFVPRPFGPEAYLVARQTMAVLGVATVALAYVLGARLGTWRAGLLAAAVLAVSPVAVFVPHEFRPDMALSFFALIALIAFSRLDGRASRDAVAGVTLGLAGAVKYTAIALVAPFVARRVALRDRRWQGILIAGSIAVLTFALCSPYSILHYRDFVDGMMVQKDYHVSAEPGDGGGYWRMARIYLAFHFANGLGAFALLAAVGGVWAKRERWRDLLPLVVFPFALTAFLSFADVQRSRLFMSALGGMAVLTGLGLDALWMRSRVLGVALTLTTLAFPLNRSIETAAAFARPGTLDRVTDWIESNAAPGRVIATTHAHIGLDRSRFEVVSMENWTPLGIRTAQYADLVIGVVRPDRAVLPGFDRLTLIEPTSPIEGPTFEILARRASDRSRKVELTSARLTASSNSDRLPSAVDGDLATRWDTDATQARGMWVAAALPHSEVIDRVELVMGARPNQWARHLEVDVSADGITWMPVKTVLGRALVNEQVDGPSGRRHVLILGEPAQASSVRLRINGDGQFRWGFAELEIYANRP